MLVKETLLKKEMDKKIKRECKKIVRDALTKVNPTLRDFLKLHKVEGKYINEATKRLMIVYSCNLHESDSHEFTREFTEAKFKDKINSVNPLDRTLLWCCTQQGGDFWRRLNSQFRLYVDK